MTNFILSTLTALTMVVSFSLGMGEAEPSASHQLTEQEQIDIYEQVMDECVIDK